MNKPLGYNPMRWNCQKSGCFNVILRPRIEQFAGCFPGRISFSDIDGIVEVGSHFLLVEWKADGGVVTGGQRIMFERMTAVSNRFTVVVVCGDPCKMTVRQIQIFKNGVGSLPEKCDFQKLYRRIESWAAKARARRVRPSKRNAA